jgi:hypothetical protein
MIHVVNIKSYRMADYPGHHVYIGRAMPGRPGSPLGNPFKLRFECDRAKILARYEYWLREQLKTDTAVGIGRCILTGLTDASELRLTNL